jgi:hypothetical protein
VSPEGEVRVQAYRKEKVWNAFELNVDAVTITVTEKKEASAPAKGEGSSAGDKAKDAWRNLKKKF